MIRSLSLKKTLLLKLGHILDELAKLGKSTQDTYNPGGWLILLDLLNEWVYYDRVYYIRLVTGNNLMCHNKLHKNYCIRNKTFLFVVRSVRPSGYLTNT